MDGWTSLACSIWALGGIQLLSLGVIGEYVGDTLDETKRRPRYIVEEVLDAPETNQEGEAQEAVQQAAPLRNKKNMLNISC